MKDRKRVVALSAGHSPGRGARAHNGTEEHAWNTRLMYALKGELEKRGYKVLTLRRSAKLGYRAAMKLLGQQMKAGGADVALELHFNHSSNPRARGFEFLYWWRSKKSRRLAACLGASHGAAFPSIPKRGTGSGERSLWYHKWNEWRAYSVRGGAYCYLTPCPAVICEPGFASNVEDWAQLEHAIEAIALADADGIDSYFEEA